MEAGRPEEIASARPEQVSAEVIRTAVLPLGPQVSQEASSNVSATLSTPATVASASGVSATSAATVTSAVLPSPTTSSGQVSRSFLFV